MNEWILRQVIERQLPPRHSPVMFQCWRKLLFLHWQWDAGEIQKHLPIGLVTDCFDGLSVAGGSGWNAVGAEIAAGRERQEYQELILHIALETAITHRLISNVIGGRQLENSQTHCSSRRCRRFRRSRCYLLAASA